MQRNKRFASLAPKYIFSEIQEREAQFRKNNPSTSLISLSVGDTTQPLAECVVNNLQMTAKALGDEASYVGYGPERGHAEIRHALSEKYYRKRVSPQDIFVSDGAGCDIGRLQILFGQDAILAIQDPAYPAYHDTGAIFRGKESIIALPCIPENNFFPDLSKALDADVVFLCSPSNPTGYAFDKEQLKQLVDFARKHKKILVVDAAYAAFTKKYSTIYEIEGAQEVAIEIGSFSKMAGFSGIRLGWTVVPNTLPHMLHQDWSRVVSTFFNGPSYLSQQAAIAVLQHPQSVEKQVAHYLENSQILKDALEHEDIEIYGGIDAPYLWLRIKGKSSWEAFDTLLHSCGIATMPGIGFGASGDGYIRISCLAKRFDIEEAARRLTYYLHGNCGINKN